MKPRRQPAAGATESKRGVKTTVELPPDVWRAAKIRAMDDYSDLRAVIIQALRTYLAAPAAGARHDRY